MKQSLTITLCLFSFAFLTAQDLTKDIFLAFKGDNVSALKSQLSIKTNAFNCFSYLLASKNLDLNKTCGGKTAAQYTAKYGNLEMLKQLNEAGAEFSNKINGRSVLDYAKKYKQDEIISFLSQH